MEKRERNLEKNIAGNARTALFALFCLTWSWPRRWNGSCIREELKLNKGIFKSSCAQDYVNRRKSEGPSPTSMVLSSIQTRAAFL